MPPIIPFPLIGLCLRGCAITKPKCRSLSRKPRAAKTPSGTQRIHAATLTNAAGAFTIILVNDGTQPKILHLTGSLRPRLYQYSYDSTLPDGLQRGPEVAPGETTVTLKPYSINALTSWQWDHLKP